MSSAPSAKAEEDPETSPPPPFTGKEEDEKPEPLRKRGRYPDPDPDPDPDPATSDPRPKPDGELLPLSKRSAVPHDVVFRILVSSRQIGGVIGKEGRRIQQIRADTGATIKIADAFARHEERVIIISSRDDESEISNAESALLSIVKVIVKETDNSIEALSTGVAHVASNTIRLLIAASQAGSLIGISGQNIEHIRKYSGATITILAQNQMPSCASAHDRVVQISGNAPEVLKALEKIGCKLRENPPRKVTSIKPSYNCSSATSDPSCQLPPSARSTLGHPLLQLSM